MTGLPPAQTPARQVSVCVQALPSLQGVPADLKPLSVQLPVPLQVSWLTHAVPASPQRVPAGSSLARQVPLPLQVSGLVHSVSAGLPQAVPVDLKPSAGQAALGPVQFSATSQSLAEPPQAVPLDLGLPLLQHWSVILPWSHLPLGLHVSVVQALPSLQSESIAQEGGSSVNFVCACEPAALAVR